MNIKLTLTFNGRDFNGWQSQKSKDGVQDVLEKSITQIYKNPIKIYGCSRTDKAVNAINYATNFKPPFLIKEPALIRAINSKLPKTIKIKNLEYVNDDFHSRFSAKSKIYIYRLYNQTKEHNYKTKIFDEFCKIEKQPLNLAKMKKTTQIFKGLHDFTAFCIKNTKNKKCNILYFNVRKIGNYYYFIIKANRFLHKMVRFLVASVIAVGNGKLKEKDVLENLTKKTRIHPIKPVEANGLFLKRVNF